jgi:uncharacterized membrane protein YagU involved in acid resistance
MRNNNRNRDIVAGAVAGLAGGLVASFVMNEFQHVMSELAKKEGENSSGSSEDIPSNEKAAQAISENVFDQKLGKAERKDAGEAVHYAMGGVSGLIYGVAAEVAPVVTVGAGAPFGAAVWVAADDLAVPALHLSKPITEYPVTTHLQALTSHLVYGLATDMVRRGVRAIL